MEGENDIHINEKSYCNDVENVTSHNELQSIEMDENLEPSSPKTCLPEIIETRSIDNTIETDIEQNLVQPNNNISHTEELFVIDGEAEVDDMLMAACFANYETAALERIEQLVTKYPEEMTTDIKSRKKTGFTEIADIDLKRLLASNNLEEMSSDNDDEDTIIDDDDHLLKKDSFEKNKKLNQVILHDDEDENESQLNDRSITHPFWSLEPVILDNLPHNVSSSSTLLKIGTVRSIVEKTLVVQAFPNQSPLDLGSVLCTTDRRVLGTVSDTFGPVSAPFYVVCNTPELITELNADVFVDMDNSSFVTEGKNLLPEYLNSAFDLEKLENMKSPQNISEDVLPNIKIDKDEHHQSTHSLYPISQHSTMLQKNKKKYNKLKHPQRLNSIQQDHLNSTSHQNLNHRQHEQLVQQTYQNYSMMESNQKNILYPRICPLQQTFHSIPPPPPLQNHSYHLGPNNHLVHQSIPMMSQQSDIGASSTHHQLYHQQQHQSNGYFSGSNNHSINYSQQQEHRFIDNQFQNMYPISYHPNHTSHGIQNNNNNNNELNETPLVHHHMGTIQPSEPSYTEHPRPYQSISPGLLHQQNPYPIEQPNSVSSQHPHTLSTNHWRQ